MQGFLGEKLSFPSHLWTHNVKEREKSFLPFRSLIRHPDSKPSLVHSGRKGGTLVTNFDQVGHYLFFPQKSFWLLWKLPQQLSTPDCDPLTAVDRFARKRKFTSYLFPNLKRSFPFPFYFLQGECSCCSSELCRLVFELKNLARMEGEPARLPLPPVAAAARRVLIYSNYSSRSAVSH